MRTELFRNVLELEHQATVYRYVISARFWRYHKNPPTWHDYHEHHFIVSIELEAIQGERDMYGLNMVEAERILHQKISEIPEYINEHPALWGGTTEQLCQFFKTIAWGDNSIRIKGIGVGETSERMTFLEVSE